jgi:hypothetical protein
MEVVLANKAVILGFLLATSEILGAFMPKVKANSVFELVIGLFKKILG